MGSRSYLLIDFSYPRQAGADSDAVIRFMEYVRVNFHSIVPGMPDGCELDLIAGGTAHNVGRRPLIGLHFPPGVPTDVPPFWEIIDIVTAWTERLSNEQFWAIVQSANSPTWAALQAMGVYPAPGDAT